MSELELNTLIDALRAELAVPVEVLVVEGPVSGVVDLPAWSPQTERLVAEYRLREGLRALVARVEFPGVDVAEAVVSPDGSEVELTVWSVRHLSNWYDAVSRASASAGGRCERRIDGQLYALGGLRWQVSLPEVLVLLVVAAERRSRRRVRSVRAEDVTPEQIRYVYARFEEDDR
ncbi:hypothetical protein KV557_10175 [Kitasatospora aureofaciens]|uniref:hypothetical protein n=1 Tax=Kitasatospora aureofaciens TaxID=1894 RepID=UPI001C48ADE9|nr:hypothetical protein [Kitasatospora aureofaciens]MBV6697491.1 hypothetical protein [Kitasatospora aureofaciens]